jgi:hypothetical protein
MTIVAITALIAAGLAHDPQSRSALFLHLWMIHAFIALALATPIVWLGRHRADWQSWELIAVVVPFSLWAGLMLSDFSLGKSLGNLGECIYLSTAVPVAALLRLVRPTSHRRAYSAFLITLLCATAVGLFFLTPPLPE